MPTWPDLMVFSVAGGLCLVAALGVVLSRNAVRSALLLALTLLGIAVMFIAQSAYFLAAVQMVVYAGAVVVLFLFVIMLLGVDRSEDTRETIRGQRPLAMATGLVLLVLLVGVLGATAGGTSYFGPVASPRGDNVQQIAQVLFTTYLYAFEITSALLVVAAIAAIVLAKRERILLRRGPETTGEAP